MNALANDALEQGIEGQYIEFDSAYTPEDEFERLQGAQWVVDPALGSSRRSTRVVCGALY